MRFFLIHRPKDADHKPGGPRYELPDTDRATEKTRTAEAAVRATLRMEGIPKVQRNKIG